MYFYKAFNFSIASELEVPEFLPGDGATDIIIKAGHVPDHLNDPVEKGLRYQIAPGEFLLNVDRIARFHVKQGKQITFEPFCGSTGNDIRLFLLGSVFGALFHQRNLLPLHASSVCFEGKAILFSGVSGIGKSTLAAAFTEKGYSMVSDDISLVIPDRERGAVIVPGYPQAKLWKDSLTMLNRHDSGLEKVRENLNKFKLDVTSGFHRDKTLEIKTVYLISVKHTRGIELHELKGAEKFTALKANIFRPKWIERLSDRVSPFSLLAILSRACDVKKISRPEDIGCLNELIERIKEDQTNG
jgi:hypothetical protein